MASSSLASSKVVKPITPCSPVNSRDQNLFAILRQVVIQSNHFPETGWSEKPNQNEVSKFLDLVFDRNKIILPENLKQKVFERLDKVEADRGTLAIMYNILMRLPSTITLLDGKMVKILKQLPPANMPIDAKKLYLDIATAAYWACSYQDDTCFDFRDIALIFGVEEFDHIGTYISALETINFYNKEMDRLEMLLDQLGDKHEEEVANIEEQITKMDNYINKNLSYAKIPLNALLENFKTQFLLLGQKAIASRDANNVDAHPNTLLELTLRDYEKEIYNPANFSAKKVNP